MLIKKAIKWLGGYARVAQHCIAVTANAAGARQFGINTILPIGNWVGGRYSFCSQLI